MELTLEQLAVKYNTDKAKFCHNYCEVYDTLFRNIRNDVKNVLEIGVAEGSSLRAWRDYFPNAIIHGIDIVDYDEATLNVFGDRIKTYNCDQNDKPKLKKLAQDIGVKFDMICDDGDHAMTSILNSLDVLFPFVKEGGLYLVEDFEHPRQFDEHLKNYTHFFCVADSPILNSNIVVVKK
jgi:cephalosporin hydroxylase